MQQVRFGVALDGERGWRARDALGKPTVGPLGFLTLLETQLGLTRLEVCHAERVVQWRARLVASSTGARFYERNGMGGSPRLAGVAERAAHRGKNRFVAANGERLDPHRSQILASGTGPLG